MAPVKPPRAPEGGGEPAVGSVAEEAARLLAALTGREPDPALFGAHRHTDEDSDPGAQDAPSAPAAGEAMACALCPVCQVIALVRTLNPETIDRLADVAAAASAALRDLAAGAAAGRETSRGAPEPARRPGPDVVDIVVTDEQEGHR